MCDKASINGICDKLKSPWKGPGLVLAMLTPYLLKINSELYEGCKSRPCESLSRSESSKTVIESPPEVKEGWHCLLHMSWSRLCGDGYF